MTVVRWKFEQTGVLAGGPSYTFEINPNEMGSPEPTRQITWNLVRRGYTGTRAPKTPTQWQFSGVLRSKEQYDRLLEWLNRRRKVTITTDLGQRFVVRLVTFTPEAERHREAAPYRHRYTMACLILDELSPVEGAR